MKRIIVLGAVTVVGILAITSLASGASMSAMILTWFSGNGRPSSAPYSGRISTSEDETVATGNTSVAPYGLCSLPLGSTRAASAQSETGTAAPAQSTRRRPDRVMPRARRPVLHGAETSFRGKGAAACVG